MRDAKARTAVPSEMKRLEASITKVQRRPFGAFVIEVEAAGFAEVSPRDFVSVEIGWFLVSSVFTGETSIRVRGFGRVRLRPGDVVRVSVQTGRGRRR